MKGGLPRTSTFYGESYIPADYIETVHCVNCATPCSVSDREFLLFHFNKWDLPLCNECSKYAKEDPNWLSEIFFEECEACGEAHPIGDCEATNGRMD